MPQQTYGEFQDSTAALSAFVETIVLSQCLSDSQQLIRPTDPIFPRTRRQLPTSVPFWFGFETGFDHRSLHQNKQSLQRLVDVKMQFAHQHQKQTLSNTTHIAEPWRHQCFYIHDHTCLLVRAHRHQPFMVMCVFNHSVALVAVLWTVLHNCSS